MSSAEWWRENGTRCEVKSSFDQALNSPFWGKGLIMKPVQEFVGGTLVEYTEGCRFYREFGRVRIIGVAASGHRVAFQTDGKAFLDAADFDEWEMRDENGVTYLVPPTILRTFSSVYYAISPPGVEIPLPSAQKRDPQALFQYTPVETDQA